MVESAYFGRWRDISINRHPAILAVDSNTGAATRGEKMRLESIYVLAVLYCRKLLR